MGASDVDMWHLTWDNKSGPGRCVNTNQGLTHPPDATRRGADGSW